ncbi:hypothetical protein [Arthrospiribacter ruber]|uniref:hypothetical protein n=1 Tax=Arthrospiribacter ruber TaxID=2487934 RepID=UPI001C5B3C1D|nr:hypothetical protein [Arthrospiribacter ruber]
MTEKFKTTTYKAPLDTGYIFNFSRAHPRLDDQPDRLLLSSLLSLPCFWRKAIYSLDQSPGKKPLTRQSLEPRVKTLGYYIFRPYGTWL